MDVLIEHIVKELYYPHGQTKYYRLDDRLLFITQLTGGEIYDVSYLKIEKELQLEQNADADANILLDELLQSIRLTSYRVCSGPGLERYLKKTYPDFSY